MGAACSSQPATNSQGTTQRANAAPGAGAIATRFQAIRDHFESIDEVQAALRKAGLESSDLVVAIDLTKSNEWSGKESFNGAFLCLVIVIVCQLHWLRTHCNVDSLVTESTPDTASLHQSWSMLVMSCIRAAAVLATATQTKALRSSAQGSVSHGSRTHTKYQLVHSG